MSLDADTASRPPTVYKLEPARFAQERRELVIRLATVVPFVLAGILFLEWHFDKERDPFTLLVFPILLSLALVYAQLREARKNWQFLAFEFRDDKLIRSLEKYPVVELVPSDVKGFLESPRGIHVETYNRHKRIFLSNKLSDYDELRNRLRSWAPAAMVTEWRPLSFGAKVLSALGVLACLCVFAGPLYLMYTTRREDILPLGIVFTLAMLGMILYVRNSPAIPVHRKMFLWLLLLLPILTILVRLYWG